MQIDLLLKFCFHQGISLVQFLTEPPLRPHPPRGSLAHPDDTRRGPRRPASQRHQS